MPELSRFFGIVISMYYETYEKHHIPHFHAHYGEYEAVYSCTGDLLSGYLPIKQEKLVIAWATLHTIELKENWYLASTHGACFFIEPLH